VSPRDVIRVRGREREALSYHISKFLVEKGGPFKCIRLREFIQEASIDGPIFC